MKSITYNKSLIMKKAWQLFKAADNKTFSTCLKESWNMAKNGSLTNNISDMYNKHYKLVYFSILRQINGNTHVAEELTNDVFEKANKHLHNYDVSRAKISTWLVTIAKNVVIDYFRVETKHNHQNISDYVDSEGNEYFQISDTDTADKSMDNNELKDKIISVVRQLKPNYRRIAVLYFIQQHNYNEISEMLDIPLGTVKAMISRTRTMLQDKLQNVYNSI